MNLHSDYSIFAITVKGEGKPELMVLLSLAERKRPSLRSPQQIDIPGKERIIVPATIIWHLEGKK